MRRLAPALRGVTLILMVGLSLLPLGCRTGESVTIAGPLGQPDPPDDEPDPGNGRYELYASGIQIENYSTLTAATILGVELSLDGALITRQSYSPATGAALLTYDLQGMTVGSGSHVLEFRITSQTSSPNTYAVNPMGVILALDNASASQVTIALHPTSDPLVPYSASLATGQSIRINFSLE